MTAPSPSFLGSRSAILPLLALLTGACGGGAELAPLGTSSASLESDNGRSLNGRSLNGITINGRSLNGVTLNSVQASGVKLGSAAVGSLSLAATVFSGSVGSARITGAGFVGTTWNGVLSDGTTLPLQVTAVAPLPAPNADLLGYALSYQTALGWTPVCGVELDGSAALAVPMTGTWNYGQNVGGAGSYTPSAGGFTFACRHFAVAKCVEMGYRPWAKSASGSQLLNYLVACTRLLRADYCGTGVSYTVDGTLLDLYDRLGIQTDSDPTWPVEAEWNANGALCVAPASGTRFSNTLLVPPCYAKLSQVGCGSSFTGAGDASALNSFIIDRYLKPAPIP